MVLLHHLLHHLLHRRRRLDHGLLTVAAHLVPAVSLAIIHPDRRTCLPQIVSAPVKAAGGKSTGIAETLCGGREVTQGEERQIDLAFDD